MMFYMLTVYVPESHSEKLKAKLFERGAGKLANYDCCAFETAGTGSFRPLEGSNPFLGKTGSIEYVNEIKIEMILDSKIKELVRQCIIEHHPYETPAFHFTKIEF